MNKVLVVVTFLLASTIVHAEIEVKDYKEAKKTGGTAWTFMETYVLGVGRGLTWANVSIKDKSNRLFCPPGKLGLGMDNYVNILDSFIDKHKISNTDAIEMLLEFGMEETFPCDSK
jgi:hypothetical protein